MARKGVIIHAGDAESCDLAERAMIALRRQGWAIRRLDRSRTRRYRDTLFIAQTGVWQNCRLVEVDDRGKPIGKPIKVTLRRALRPVDELPQE